MFLFSKKSRLKKLGKLILLLAALLILPGLTERAFAGWVLTGQYIDIDGRVMPQRFFIENNKVKYEMHDYIYIFDLKTNGLILINIDRLTYCKTTLGAYLDYERSLMKQRLDELMESVPEEQQAVWREQYMQQVKMHGTVPAQSADSVTINDTKIDFKIGNFETDKYAVSLNGLRVEEVWIAPGIKVEPDFSWDRYFEFMAALSLREGDLKLMTAEPYRALLSTGYPLRRIMYSQFGTNEWQVNLIEEKNIPDYEFYTPDLCKSVTLQQWYTKTVEKNSGYDDYE